MSEFLRSEHVQSCELELTLGVGEAGAYNASLRFKRPDDDAEHHRLNRAPVVIDRKRLGELKGNAQEYGAALWGMLFGSPYVQRALELATVNARARGFALRVRLLLLHEVSELHSIWWETLVDPATGSPILMREDFVFSRYLDSPDGRPVELERAHTLRVLCAVANPQDIDQYEVNNRALGKPDPGSVPPLGNAGGTTLDVEVLGDTVPVTLANVIDRLRSGFDILYLVCHGALVNKEPRIYLEDQQRRTAVVAGNDLVDRLRDMVDRPRLIVLASCQSAGSGAQTTVGDDGALAALGPRLMNAGIPAVLAMQGNVTMTTVEHFMPVLFEQLSAHGQIDRAVAVARGAVRERRDWWMPVLFMRLVSGSMWYTPTLASDVEQNLSALATDAAPDYKWDALVNDLDHRETVMVLGTGLGETVLGSSREIARDWADEYSFPMAPQKRDDLPQVTQYLAYTRNASFPLKQLRHYMIKYVRRRHAGLLRNFPETPAQNDYLDVLVREVGSRLRACIHAKEKSNERARGKVMDASSPIQLPYPNLTDMAYTQLARLPVTTYVTTNRDNLLFDSLKAEQREPEMVVCRWKPMRADQEDSDSEWPQSVFEREANYVPSFERPLIYHVFGNMSYPHTVVLTEDDYFDFLVGFTRNQGNARTSMPSCVKKVLATHGLVFLGFQFEDWEFRTLFRGVLPREGAQAGGEHSSVAVQIEPSDEHMHKPAAARDYMKSYFSRNRNIEVYWGKSEDFLTELTKRWKQITR